MSNGCDIQIPFDDIIDAIINNDEYLKKIIDALLKKLDLSRIIKTYYASVHINLETTCSPYGDVQHAAAAFHPDDDKDPAATVPVVDEEGSVIAYIYPDNAKGHDVPVYDKRTGEIIGYGLGTATMIYIRLATTYDCGDLQDMYSTQDKHLGYNHPTDNTIQTP